MAVYDRCSRILWLLPILFGRVLVVTAASIVLYHTIKTVITQFLMANTPKASASYTISIVWSSMALGVLAEQRLQAALYFERMFTPQLHARLIRKASGGPWYNVGIWAQTCQIAKLFLSCEVDANGNLNMWNHSWTVTVISSSLYSWEGAMVRSGQAGLRLWSSHVIELHYWVPSDRFTSTPLQEHATLEIRGWRKNSVTSFISHCKAFTTGTRAPLLSFRPASVSMQSFEGMTDAKEDLDTHFNHPIIEIPDDADPDEEDANPRLGSMTISAFVGGVSQV